MHCAQGTALVRHVFRLLEQALRDERGVPWVLLENVRTCTRPNPYPNRRLFVGCRRALPIKFASAHCCGNRCLSEPGSAGKIAYLIKEGVRHADALA